METLTQFLDGLAIIAGLLGAVYWFRSTTAKITFEEGGKYSHDWPQNFEDKSGKRYELVSSLLKQSSMNRIAAALTGISIAAASISNFIR